MTAVQCFNSTVVAVTDRRWFGSVGARSHLMEVNFWTSSVGSGR
jgi:hypothetical protein